ncbi:menaquinone via futalosine step 1 [Campylobacter sp. MIT 99-7217]|uniref:MqnA/MqnD/SBP family protein n=1 Tax=Campylobacter sp. MIT 99-7217 TaxID=535091 RepID=UPI001157B9ED|nr:MqnA/MqnD/SBP family protein [Campylobacter sp. MIT 99-7217]TQR33855.1 menaquinone via futalosine step 1 [Campylobacter sp. MIT 99-7217]
MIFGKIDYINLLPLHIYLKKYPLPSGIKMAMEHKKGVPSKLNHELFYRRIDAAIISSIESVRKKYTNLNIGICSNKRVLSVLVQKNRPNEADKSSASSNALAKVLGQKGKVIIGDAALKLFLKNPKAYNDLCALWYEKTGLPFVFARFSCTQKKALFAKILKNFPQKNIKIPQYILKDYAQKRGIAPQDIRFYLDEVIYYRIANKEQKALKKFTRAVKFNINV